MYAGLRDHGRQIQTVFFCVRLFFQNKIFIKGVTRQANIKLRHIFRRQAGLGAFAININKGNVHLAHGFVINPDFYLKGACLGRVALGIAAKIQARGLAAH